MLAFLCKNLDYKPQSINQSDFVLSDCILIDVTEPGRTLLEDCRETVYMQICHSFNYFIYVAMYDSLYSLSSLLPFISDTPFRGTFTALASLPGDALDHNIHGDLLLVSAQLHQVNSPRYYCAVSKAI